MSRDQASSVAPVGSRRKVTCGQSAGTSAEEGHAGDHRGDEHEDLHRAKGQRGQRRARAQANKAPADAEQRRAADQAWVEVAPGRDLQPRCEDGPPRRLATW